MEPNEVKHDHPSEVKLRVDVVKNTDGYTWEIAVTGTASSGEAVELIAEAVAHLTARLQVE